MRLKLKARPPFSLPAVIRSHGWVRLAPFDSDDDLQRLTYLYRLSSGRVAELSIDETADGVEVGATGRFGKRSLDEISESVSWMLGLDQDFADFYRLARREPKLARVPKLAKGRLLRSPTLFEDTVKTILTTNTSWAGTIRMVRSVVSQFGDPLRGDPSRRAFPTPEQLASTDEQRLRLEVGLGYRAPYVLELARAVAGGKLELESLKGSEIPTEELRDRLLSIKGVGAYAAANLLMLLGRYDYLTIDSWALKVVSHEWHAGEPIEAEQVQRAFESWGEWKGLAYWFWDWSYTGES